MSDRDRIKQVIDRLPDYKLAYVENLILDIEKTHIEEVGHDEWDLKMISDAAKNNDKTVASPDELSNIKKRQNGFQGLLSFAGTLPKDFDYKKELEEMREEKYARFI